jgi:ADP-heptose:LPS heptosyltransferase
MGDHLEFPISAKEERGFEALVANHTLQSPYLVVHAGSQLRSRRWPAERFAAVAQALGELSFRIVLTGTASEAALVHGIASGITHPTLDLTGRTTIGELAALIGGAALLVSNDTGVSHIAAALRTPSVVIACGSDVERWRPLDTARHRTLSMDIECRPCGYETCPIGHPCALGVSVKDVVTEALVLLGRA